MRLSFPNNSRGAPTSQSDSGLGEDNFQSHSEKRNKRQQALPPSSGKRWSLSVKNPQGIVFISSLENLKIISF